MLNIIIFGAPGAGKGTQSKLLLQRFGLSYISTGEELRKIICKGGKSGQVAKALIDQGKLAPDQMVVHMISDFLDRHPQTQGFLFDGFPRTIPQAVALNEILDKRGMAVSLLIDLQVEDGELIRRLMERGKISGRSDDNAETIQARLDIYHTQTAPLATYYISEGKYAPINGIGTEEEIFRRILEAVRKQEKSNE
ncbi:MAG: adenylate kinase [Tannerella sp.]|jgi:adenylate kinase|nr:adenylate kinase [Tannerella sp.]